MNPAPVLRAALLPVVLIAAYGILRLARIQPETEAGMSELLTTIFFVAGAAVCDFAACLLAGRGDRTGSGRYFGRWFWSACLLLLLGLDETFRIHEVVGPAIGVADTAILLSYAVPLVAVLWAFRGAGTLFRTFVVLFALCAITSLAGDYFYGEGVVRIGGRDIDFEQIVEVFAALFLSLGFSVEAAREIEAPGG